MSLEIRQLLLCDKFFLSIANSSYLVDLSSRLNNLINFESLLDFTLPTNNLNCLFSDLDNDLIKRKIFFILFGHWNKNLCKVNEYNGLYKIKFLENNI